MLRGFPLSLTWPEMVTDEADFIAATALLRICWAESLATPLFELPPQLQASKPPIIDAPTSRNVLFGRAAMNMARLSHRYASSPLSSKRRPSGASRSGRQAHV